MLASVHRTFPKLRQVFADSAYSGPNLVDSLLNSLNLALMGALSDMFTALWVTAAPAPPTSRFGARS